MHDLGFRPVRRRQPLLRGRGRLHPPHRPGHGQAVHAVGRGRTARSACWWPGRSTSSSRTPPSTRSPQPGSLEDYFRGRNDERPRPEDDVRRPRPDRRAPRLPRPRRPRCALLDEQGMDGALLFPTLGVGMQEALQRRRARPARRLRRLQPLARRRLGLRPRRRPALRRADDHLRRPRPGRRRGASGCSAAGARILVAIPGPVPDGDDGYVSPGHPKFDPVWGLHRRVGRAAGAPRRAQRRRATTAASGGRAATAAVAGSTASSTPPSRWSPSPTAASPTRSPR